MSFQLTGLPVRLRDLQVGRGVAVALVCAASKGLGRASAEALARDGFRVAICARGGDALARRPRRARRRPAPRCSPIQADLVSAGGRRARARRDGGALRRARRPRHQHRRPAVRPLHDARRARLDRAPSTRCSSASSGSAAAPIPHMQARGGGRIINITSISVKQPIAGWCCRTRCARRSRRSPRRSRWSWRRTTSW